MQIELVYNGQKAFKNLNLMSKWKSPQLLTENHHNFGMVQDSLMKFYRWADLINLCLIDKNENSCISRFWVNCPWSIKLKIKKKKKKKKNQELSFLSTTHCLTSWENLWRFIKLSCTVQELCWFSLSDFTFSTNDLTPTGRLLGTLLTSLSRLTLEPCNCKRKYISLDSDRWQICLGMGSRAHWYAREPKMEL